MFYDDGLYAGLGWAVGHGLGYVYPNLPGTPAAVHYPPLYPLVLAPLFAFLSVPTAAFAGKVLNVTCSAAACGLIASHIARLRLLGDATPRWLGASLVAASALAIPVLTVLTVLFSEPLFALLFVATIMVADRASGASRISPEAGALLAGSGAALALLVRSIGVALGLAVLVRVYQDARSERRGVVVRRLALAGLPLFAAGVGWAAWVALHRRELDPLLAPDYGSYFAILRGSGLAALRTSALDLARPLGVLTLSWVPNRAVYYACGIPALAVGLYGLAHLVRRSTGGVALAGYLAILACWPVPPDRFLWAVLPWLVLAWAAGAIALWRHRLVRPALIALVVLLGFGYARYEWRGARGRWWALAGDRISQTFAIALPALDSLPPEAVVATDHDPLVWLYSRRSAVPLYIYALQGPTVLEPPPPVHRAYLERQGVTHLLVELGSQGATEADRLQRAYPGWLRPVRQWPDRAVLLEVVHDR